MGYTTIWRSLSPRQLNFAIQLFSLICIFFEGYDQGVMGGVNAAPYYVTEVGIGEPDGTVTDTTHQGGIVSIYYLGCIFGCFAGGWLADRIGRINGLFIGSIFAAVGGALQAAIQSSDFMLVARVITGIGTGALTGITPVLVSETSSAQHRGGFLGYVFIANYLGISVAYWLSFGLAFINNGYSDIRWRFLLAFQCVPAILLVLFIKMLPDSPRYYASVGRNEEARDLLTRIREHKATPEEIEREYLEIVAMAQDSQPSSPIQFGKILVGRGGRPGANLGRRAWLCVWLQIMGSWTGITAVTAYSPVLLSQAGYSDLTQNGLAGGLNTIGIIGTIISAQIVDRIGRRMCLMLGALSLFIVEVVAGSVYEASLQNPDKASQYAPAAVAMLFLFNLAYASTWGTVAFLIPTEIFPSDLRAQGNGFGITGWAIGVGMTTLVNPIMFDSLKSRSYFLLAGLNLLWIPIVYLFYPETCNRSLESIDALFSTPSPFFWEMERAYKLHSDVLAERGIEVSAGKVEEERSEKPAESRV
ncbi:Putative Sugar/inositol transporter [Aspergillus calidoustus]|uniref:Putative Sugar/inositol transporter n=1 Tax=Aspergillus calidoustus TaxID=454130 RepID=A0A0U5GDZ1_ASPCI|nr:Putative Sugar/inositol transporter [Aspergillus calidoustus]